MTRKALDTAIDEARRFLAKAEALRDREDGKDAKSRALEAEKKKGGGRAPHWFPLPDPPAPMRAAVKRASLDLTRALAALRRPL